MPPEILRISTADLPEQDRVAAFCDSYGRTIIMQDADPAAGQPFHFAATLLALNGLAVASGICSPLNGRHHNGHLGSDDLVLKVTLSGERVVTQRGREAVVRDGEAVLLSSAEVSESRLRSTSRIVSFRIPLDTIRPMITGLDERLVQTIPRETEALRLLTGYVAAIGCMDALAAPELRHSIVAHVHDLISLTIGATCDAARAAQERGVRAARLRAIKGDILDNLGRDDLSIASVAARHQISPRYVRRLLESDGCSFSDLVLGERLRRVHRMLSDPRLVHQPISAIALGVGFGDLSYFNRTFRRRYQMTPSDLRERTRRGEA